MVERSVVERPASSSFQPIMADRVSVNAGGRIFETTTTTLFNSCYFASLAKHATTASSSRHKKRIRTSSSGSSGSSAPVAAETAEPNEIFIDRDPDLFADVLRFLRSNRLPAAVELDPVRLADLAVEAEFFGLDTLKDSCKAATRAMRTALEPPEPPPKPTARTFGLVLYGPEEPVAQGEHFRQIPVKKGEVLFITAATLAGTVESCRYNLNEDDKKKRLKDHGEDSKHSMDAGCFIGASRTTDNSGDYQLIAEIDDLDHDDMKTSCSIAHVALDHFWCDSGNRSPMHYDLKQELRVCLDGGRQEFVKLIAEGGGEWHITGWIGNPAAIPPLRSATYIAKTCTSVGNSYAKSSGTDKLDTTLALSLALGQSSGGLLGHSSVLNLLNDL